MPLMQKAIKEVTYKKFDLKNWVNSLKNTFIL